MGDFSTGFATGFLRTLGTNMQARKDEADKYFNEQMERARTIGLKVKGQVDQAVNTSATTAKQLQQMGVPKEVIMAIANQNPSDLGSFYDQVNEAAAAGIPIDQEFFDDFVKVSADFKAPDEDWKTFFGRIYKPLAANVKADPEGFKRDRKGGIAATMLGYNAMDTARERLATTEIEGGMTAEQLLQYGEDLVPNKPLGDTVVTYDYGKLGEKTKEAKGDKELSLTDYAKIKESFDEKVKTILRSGNTNFQQATPEEIAEAKRQAAEELALEFEKLGMTTAAETARKMGGEPETEERVTKDDVVVTEETPAEAPEKPVEAPEGDVATPTTTEGDNAPIDPDKEPELYTPLPGYNFIQDNGDGTSDYDTPTGVRTYSNAEVRELVRKSGE